MKTCANCQFLVADADTVCGVCGADSSAGPTGRAVGPTTFDQPPPNSGVDGPPKVKWGVAKIAGVVAGCVVGWIGGYLVVDALLDSADEPGVSAEESSLGIVEKNRMDAVEIGELGAWTVFSPPDDSFTIELPGEGSAAEVPLETRGGETVSQWVVAVGDETTTYGISWQEAHLGLGHESLTADLSEVVQGIAAAMQGEVVREEPAMLAGMEAARFRMELPDGEVALGVIASDGQRFYQLIVGGSDPDDHELDRMAESLSLPG